MTSIPWPGGRLARSRGLVADPRRGLDTAGQLDLVAGKAATEDAEQAGLGGDQ
ncbi:hypothetical protein [Candidatus Poriferisocius sp.]|uniref:hypothetical protein n=1 Tax=Candidatus Poriferisocius sp. TaxID=3101276 RepID=UPI003B010B9D